VKLFIAGTTVGLVIGVIVTLLYFVLVGASVHPQGAFGRFIGSVQTTWLEDGRGMELNKDLSYVDLEQKVWLAPAGSIVDGASIPQPFWSILGGPFEGEFRNASVVHDVACVERTEPPSDVHRMFYFACRCGGVSEKKAKAMYYAVARFGPQWKLVYQVRSDGERPFKTAHVVDVVETRDPSDEEVQLSCFT